MSNLNSERKCFLLNYLAEIDADVINKSFQISIEEGLKDLSNCIDIFRNYIFRKYRNLSSSDLEEEYYLYFYGLLKYLDHKHRDILLNKINLLKIKEVIHNYKESPEEL